MKDLTYEDMFKDASSIFKLKMWGKGESMTK